MYTITHSFISNIKLGADGNSVDIDMTIQFIFDGADKTTPSSTGCTINLDLKIGERNTMLSELNDKTEEWFNLNYNN